MNKFISLTKIMLKAGFGDSGKKNAKASKNYRKKQYMMIAFIIIAFIPTMIMIGAFSKSIYKTLAPMNQEGYFLAMAFYVICMMNFIFGIFTTLNVFYYSKDIGNLLPLPLRAWQIIGAKFITVIVYNYATEMILLFPIIIGFGLGGKLGILYWIYSLIIFLVLPIIPLIYASVLNMLMMRFTGFAKYKDKLSIVGGILVMAFALGINVIIQRSIPTLSDPSALISLMGEGNNSMIGTMNTIFPSAKYASLAAANYMNIGGLLNLGIFTLLNFVIAGLFIFFSEKLYFKGVIGISEVTSKRKKMSEAAMDKNMRKSPLLFACTMKEIKLLVRTPAYFMNCVIINFLWPFFLALPFVIQPETLKSMGTLVQYLFIPEYQGIILIGAVVLGVFTTASNSIASSSISREGENIFFMKYIPVAYEVQLMAKIGASVIFSFTGFLVTIFLMIIFIKLPIHFILAILISIVPAIFFASFSGLLIDLKFPKLVWDNEQKAVKQNLNSLYNMAVAAVICGILIFIVVYFKLTTLPTFIIVNGVFILADIFIYKYIKRAGTKLLEQLM